MCPSCSKLLAICPFLRRQRTSSCTLQAHSLVSISLSCILSVTDHVLCDWNSLFLGSDLQVDDHFLKHRWPVEAGGENLAEPADCHFCHWSHLDALLIRRDAYQLQLGDCECFHGGLRRLPALPQIVSPLSPWVISAAHRLGTNLHHLFGPDVRKGAFNRKTDRVLFCDCRQVPAEKGGFWGHPVTKLWAVWSDRHYQ